MSRDWFVKYRQDWIAETVLIFGFIRREHIVRKFNVSMQQASADLTMSQSHNPNALIYDKSDRVYRSPSYPRRRFAVE